MACAVLCTWTSYRIIDYVFPDDQSQFRTKEHAEAYISVSSQCSRSGMTLKTCYRSNISANARYPLDGLHEDDDDDGSSAEFDFREKEKKKEIFLNEENIPTGLYQSNARDFIAVQTTWVEFLFFTFRVGIRRQKKNP